MGLYPISDNCIFGSVVEHRIIDPAARVRFPPKSCFFFQPNLLCFVLCYGFHVVRPSFLQFICTVCVFNREGIIFTFNAIHIFLFDLLQICDRAAVALQSLRESQICHHNLHNLQMLLYGSVSDQDTNFCFFYDLILAPICIGSSQHLSPF